MTKEELWLFFKAVEGNTKTAMRELNLSSTIAEKVGYAATVAEWQSKRIELRCERVICNDGSVFMWCDSIKPWDENAKWIISTLNTLGIKDYGRIKKIVVPKDSNAIIYTDGVAMNLPITWRNIHTQSLVRFLSYNGVNVEVVKLKEQEE